MMILTYFLLILVVYQLPYSYSYYNSLNTNNKNNNNNSKLPINVVVIGSLSYLDQLQSIFDHKIHIYSIKCSKETRIDFKVEIDIVVIEKCRDDYDNQELLHTYQYFDHLIDILKKWKTKFPTASIVWSVPETVRQYSRDDRIIRNFLIKKYIKEGLSVKVIFPYRRKSDSFQRLTKEQVKKSLVDPLQKLLLSYRVDSNSIYNHVQVENGNFSIANHCSKFIHTRKYDDKCFPSPKLDSDKIYPVLITGLGGAGTHFVSNFLNDIGYRFRHERLGKDGSVVSIDVFLYLNYS